MATMNLAKVLLEIERDLGMTGQDFARILAIDARAWGRWKSGESYPQKEARVRLDALVRFHGDLLDVFTPDAARTWLHGESPYLGSLTPADAIRVGRLDRAEAALEAIDTGVFI